MGFFGKFVFSDGEWSEQSSAPQRLSIDIHDSDFATVEYEPSKPHTGRFYLGYEPRHYFDDAAASEPVDLVAELEGFLEWAKSTLGVQLAIGDLRELVADPDGADPDKVFVEETVVQLVELLKVPLPPDLQLIQ